MTWYSHKLVTFSIVLATSGDLILGFLSSAFSVIPDSLEGFDYESERWKKNHRRISHWPVLYLILLIAGTISLLSIQVKFWKVSLYKIIPNLINDLDKLPYGIVGYLLLAIGLGGLLHVFEDALSAKVPLLHPTRRTFGIHLIKTGSTLEYLISTTFLIATLYFIYLK